MMTTLAWLMPAVAVLLALGGEEPSRPPPRKKRSWASRYSSSSAPGSRLVFPPQRSSSSDSTSSPSTIPSEYSWQWSQAEPLTTLEVCMSPGCRADGAQATLERLQALAPPHVVVKAGGCISQCGRGPVVVQSGSIAASSTSSSSSDHHNHNQHEAVKNHRKVTGDKILELLYNSGSSSSSGASNTPSATAGSEPAWMPKVPQDLVRGYDLALEADRYFGQQQYAPAAERYEQVYHLSFYPAQALRQARESRQPRAFAVTTVQSRATAAPPVGLQWLVRARYRQAACYLALGQVETAMLAAQSACNLSRNTSPEAFQILAQVYARKGDAAGEIQALQTMFALDESLAALAAESTTSLKTTKAAALELERRELRFRLDKLLRQVSNNNNNKTPKSRNQKPTQP